MFGTRPGRASCTIREGIYKVPELTCVEICAGAGGQSLGLERAGFSHVAAVEIDPDACATLRLNWPDWDVISEDVHHFKGIDYRGVDLLAGGVPCPPFSIAGKQLGADDERDLFPQALRLVEECEPAAVMLENVRGLATAPFAGYRRQVVDRLRELGYETEWQVLNASEFGVPQLRPRFILVAMTAAAHRYFEWPSAIGTPPTVGEALRDLMAAGGWPAPAPGPGRPAGSGRRWSAAPASTAVPTSARRGPGRPGSSWESTAGGWPARRPGPATPCTTFRG